jgi:8-oxo-dGTP pyrophosphatase MutT (NUDIX family)
MTGCEATMQAIPDAAAGLVPPRARELIIEHAKACPRCERELGAWVAIIGALREAPPAVDLRAASLSNTGVEPEAGGRVWEKAMALLGQQRHAAALDPMQKAAPLLCYDPVMKAYWGRRAAGVVVHAQDTGRVLLLHRSDGVMDPGLWGVPGGRIDQGDGARKTLHKEAVEELGRIPEGFQVDGEHAPHVWKAPDADFQYHTYVAHVPHEFAPDLNWEHTEHRWVDPAAVTGNMPSVGRVHPNVVNAIAHHDARGAFTAAAPGEAGLQKAAGRGGKPRDPRTLARMAVQGFLKLRRLLASTEDPEKRQEITLQMRKLAAFRQKLLLMAQAGGQEAAKE